MSAIRTDFDKLQDGARITLHPLPGNPLHNRPVTAIYSGGYFYCDGTDPAEGPDYYLADVLVFNAGFTAEGAEA
ncbi:hypothetical protein [uncultured Devosia sp.]|uniref:hypothetical protein n=1 Tax=uncultured Devosia sp. TaxID=211434 RepID=UPI002626B6F4|nr:hypothetical protein [uncultured Devosia sp.]